MVQYRVSSVRRARRSTLRNLSLTAVLAAASLSPALFFAGGPVPGNVPHPAPSNGQSNRAQMRDPVAIAATGAFDRTFVDPAPALQDGTLDFTRNAPLDATFRPLRVPRETSVVTLAPPAQQEPAQPPQPAATVTTAQSMPVVPLPVPRPPEFRTSKSAEPPRTASAPASRPIVSAAAPSAPADNPSFLERLFGVRRAAPPPSALSYAALESPGSAAPGGRFGFGPSPSPDSVTAVYDISAQVVHMPNGERLEAHSGLGAMLDDPRYVHVRMRGATPPGTYTLTEREQLFHGVRALRLNPVGGSAAIHGRDGLLAHTYMLGPNGDSNGCVSFRNYDRFLQAYLRGEVKRLVVVTGRAQDPLPRVVNSRNGMLQRS
jgi:hypothetical protein